MRHSGLCVKRQYAAFAGIANGGEKCNAFFDKLVRRGHTAAVDCIHSRARLYHIHNRLLYHAIGEPVSRYRRPVPVRLVAERLMRLDAALTSPDCDWLTTRADKLAYLQTTAVQDAPSVANECPGTFPIGIDPSGRIVLLYLVAVPWTEDFRAFLVAHTALLGVTPAWTLRLVFPQSLRRAFPAYEAVVHEELESPLQADTIYDLRRYFFHRRRGTDLNAIPEVLRPFLTRCQEVFAGSRFTHLYRRWLTEDESALQPVSRVIPEALAAGRAQVECVVLPHSYEHLSPLISRRRKSGKPLQRYVAGHQAPRAINPPLNPLLNPVASKDSILER